MFLDGNDSLEVHVLTILHTWIRAHGEADYGNQRLVLFDRKCCRRLWFIHAYPNEQTARIVYRSFLPTFQVGVLRANSATAALWKGSVSNIDDAAVSTQCDIDPTAKEHQGCLV